LLATKTQCEYIERARKREGWEIANLVEQGRRKSATSTLRKSPRKNSDETVRVITSHRNVWVDTMMKEELGLIEDSNRPRGAAIATFAAFNARQPIAF